MIKIIGDIIIDEYWYGNTTRLSPEAPVPVVNLTNKKISIGGAGNVYMNIRSLTKHVSLDGYIDEQHKHIFDKIEMAGNLQLIDNMPHKLRIFSGSHYISRVDTEKYILETSVEKDFTNKDKYGIVILSDYNKGTVKNPQDIISKSKRVIVDPKVSLDNYRGAYILKPNLVEFEDYIGHKTTAKNLISSARAAREHLNIEHFVVTLGSEGVLYIGDRTEHYPATAIDVYDVTGAGDTFTAALAIGLWYNLTVEDAVKVANKMSGHAVSHNGTYTINPKEYDIAMGTIHEYINNRAQGIYREESLALF